ncbi:MAG: uracil-DNA glycosylase [Verrucomicrobia bacterium]|nr:uracil-DNA glycosylase [Verrucomicrobiota bacterium]
MSNEAAGLLKHFLEQRQVAGQTHVVLKPGMLDRLKQRGKPSRPAQPDVPMVSLPMQSRAAMPQPAPKPTAQPAPSTSPKSSAAVASLSSTDKVALIEVTGQTKAEKLAALAAHAGASSTIQALGTLRPILVSASGSPDADILFIGEAPGMEEEEAGQPFMGPAGQKLTGIITAMGLKREAVYLTHFCKQRPAIKGEQGIANRAATDQEMRAFLPYILTEISIVAPKVVIVLGPAVAGALSLGESMIRLRGKFHQVQGIQTIVTFHPNYILREEKLAGGGLKAKRELWEDMLKVMQTVGLPISEKQSNYFKK